MTHQRTDAAAVRDHLPSDPHCRIAHVRFKRRTRYRSPAAFDLMTNRLLRITDAFLIAKGRG